MGELHPAGQAPAPTNGELIDDSLTPSPEVTALLGEDVVGYMDRASGALGELGTMAETEDPFAHDDRGCQVDLSFLKPEQVKMVHTYRTAKHPFRDMSPTSVARLGYKIARKSPVIYRDVGRMLANARPRIDESGDKIGRVANEGPENMEVSTLPSLRECMDDLIAARDLLPSKTTLTVVDNTYSAGISARNHLRSMAGQHRIKARPPEAVIRRTEALRQRQVDFKDVVKAVDSERRLGSANYRLLSTLVELERIKEAMGVIATADKARQRLPDMDAVEGDELESALAAERYLASHAAMAGSVLDSTDPELLQDDWVRSRLDRLHPSYRARQREAEQAQEIQAAIGNGVLSKLTETKNALRGGRRLKPGKGQTESEVKQTADDLYALKDGDEERMLNPEETGLIVAMVVGRFEELTEVISAVQTYKREHGMEAFPADRVSVITEICRFDLQAALAKIDGLMEDVHNRLHLERILGMPNTRLVRDYLSRALETQEEADAAA